VNAREPTDPETGAAAGASTGDGSSGAAAVACPE